MKGQNIHSTEHSPSLSVDDFSQFLSPPLRLQPAPNTLSLQPLQQQPVMFPLEVTGGGGHHGRHLSTVELLRGRTDPLPNRGGGGVTPRVAFVIGLATQSSVPHLPKGRRPHPPYPDLAVLHVLFQHFNKHFRRKEFTLGDS